MSCNVMLAARVAKADFGSEGFIEFEEVNKRTF